MQAGTQIILEENLVPKASVSSPVEGLTWVLGGRTGRRFVHWTYKPFKNGPLETALAAGTSAVAESHSILDSIRQKFQMNENAFCQWFSLIALRADHGDASALGTYMSFQPFENISNAVRIINFVEGSEWPVIDSMRRDMLYLPNAVAFYNNGKPKVLHISAAFLKRSVPKAYISGQHINAKWFFNTLRSAAVSLEDFSRSRSRSRSRKPI